MLLESFDSPNFSAVLHEFMSREMIMGTYGNFNLVMREWKLGNITEAQAIGQILQLLEELEKRVAELERITKPPKIEKEIKETKGNEGK